MAALARALAPRPRLPACCNAAARALAPAHPARCVAGGRHLLPRDPKEGERLRKTSAWKSPDCARGACREASSKTSSEPEIPKQQQEHPGEEHKMHPRPEYEPKYPGSGRLQGKVAIVTGADSGIGRATAVLFAREGAKVAVMYLSEDQDAQETQKAVEKEGSKALLIRGDVRSKAFCKEAVDKTVKEFGRLDVLVNNAAMQQYVNDVREVSEEQLRTTFETNIYGYFFMVQAALDHLQPGSSIVNIASVNAFAGNKIFPDYSSSKGAIVAFSRSLATSLAPKKIVVGTVAPGPIWTPFIPTGASPGMIEGFGADMVPWGRPGQPNEVAPACLFFACEDGSYCTGQTIHPNGGMIVGS